MNLEALSLRYASLRGPEWVLVGVAIAAVAVVSWETLETKMGSDRPMLRVAAGILLSFFGGMAVERGILFVRSGASTRTLIVNVFPGFVSLAMSILYILRRRAPRSILERLNERAKPPLMFDKRDD